MVKLRKIKKQLEINAKINTNIKEKFKFSTVVGNFFGSLFCINHSPI